MTLASGTYHFKNSSLAKAVRFAQNTIGSPLSLSFYAAEDNQTWILRHKADGTYTIRNAAYSEDDPAYAAVAKDAIGERVNLRRDAYYWEIAQVSAGVYRISTTSNHYAWGAHTSDEMVYLTERDTSDQDGLQLWEIRKLLENPGV